MRTMNRLEQPFRGASTLQEQINRVFGEIVGRTGEESNLTPWAPAVDIYETENELVVKADLPDVNPQDLDIRVENNILTIRGDASLTRRCTTTTTCASNAPMVPSAGASRWPTPSTPTRSRPTITMAC